MKEPFSLEKLKEIVERKLGFKLVSETEYELSYLIKDELVEIIDKNSIYDIINKMNTMNTINQTNLFDDNYYEALIKTDRGYYLRGEDRKVRIEDKVNGISYEISSMSNHFVCFVLNSLFDGDKKKTRLIPRTNIFKEMVIKRHFEKNNSMDENIIENEKNIFSLINSLLLGSQKTIKIYSSNKRDEEAFDGILHSFIFHYSYNLNYHFYIYNSIDELYGRVQARQKNKLSSEQLEAPKKNYIKELVVYHQRGLMSDTIEQKFLSFYHVIENFFEEVYEEEIIKEIKKVITKPSFSHKKVSELKNLVNVIKKKIQIGKQDFNINEIEALELVLKKYITDLDDFVYELNIFDDLTTDYYQKNNILFSGGRSIDFNSKSLETILKHIAQRIYSTRNSIVHSKDNGKNRYTPFRDDKVLEKELHLLKVISEFVIINSAKEV